VLLAKATRVVRDNRSGAAGSPPHQHHRAVRFRVERVYKGNIPEADVGDGGGRRKPSLVVASFSAVPDAEQCVAQLVTRGSRYVVFLRNDDTGRSALAAEVRTSTQLQRRRQQKIVGRRRRRLRISAFPVLVTDDVIGVVELYADCGNRCRKYRFLHEYFAIVGPDVYYCICGLLRSIIAVVCQSVTRLRWANAADWIEVLLGVDFSHGFDASFAKLL